MDRIHGTSTVEVVAIDGMAGVGKTALAVHAAHRIADRYPDGQLFIDLHGYTHGVEPIKPGDALDRMLRALGTPGPMIPASLEERAALYRTRLADQRILIVLDNAATESQVAPLLPGGPGCLVLVTSRRRLAGLDHTRALSLDTLPSADAVRLFIQTAGESRVARRSRELVVELVELCGWLPLAIRIAASRLRSHSSWGLTHLVERLRDQRHRLSELEAGQRSVTAALDLSYHDLSPDQQHTYRLFGLHPGPDIDRYATAALLDSSLRHAAGMLDQIFDAHLLLEPAAGRYRFHDLTRAHAAHTATRNLTSSTGRAAVDRLLDYYRHTASVAMDAAYPYERERRPQVPGVATPVPDLPDPTAALRWLDTELPNLLATAWYAIECSRPAHILDLSTMLHRHLRTRGHYHDAETLHQQALNTARNSGHQTGQLNALTGLGHLHRMQGRYEQAIEHFGRALRIARAAGDCPGELDALNGLGDVRWVQGRYVQAADHYQEALQMARAAGDCPGELDALNGVGDIHWVQGRYEKAADYLGQALQIARATGHRPGELNALNGLGWIHLEQGQYIYAADHHQRALQIARTTGHQAGELAALAGLGWVDLRRGRYGQATDNFRQALDFSRINHHRMGELAALVGLGQLYRIQSWYGEATDTYQQLLELAQEKGDRNFEFEARQGLGRLQHATGYPDAAITHHEQALALAGELGQAVDQARAHDGLAHAYHTLKQHRQAREHWQNALDILIRLSVDRTNDEETTTAAIRAHLAAYDHQQEDPDA